MIGPCIGCLLRLSLAQDGQAIGWNEGLASGYMQPLQLAERSGGDIQDSAAKMHEFRHERSSPTTIANDLYRDEPDKIQTDRPAGQSTAADMTASPMGDVIVTAKRRSRGDPLESINASSFKLTQRVDASVTAPASRFYERVTPKPVRSGIRNFLNNLREPVVFVNFLLQHKVGKSFETFARFAINSTVGVAGVMDVAHRCPFNLPWRRNGFSDTMAFYGVGPGPYLYLPLGGPTTVRDLVGGIIDRFASPMAFGGVFRSKSYLISTNVYRLLDRRAEQDPELRDIRNSADPYVARRQLYLNSRHHRIDELRGTPMVDASTVQRTEERVPENCKGDTVTTGVKPSGSSP